MSLEEIALALPRIEKLRLMEALWSDLASQPETMESPAWHQAALRDTEARLAAGTEEIMDWSEAKKRLTGGR